MSCALWLRTATSGIDASAPPRKRAIAPLFDWGYSSDAGEYHCRLRTQKGSRVVAVVLELTPLLELEKEIMQTVMFFASDDEDGSRRVRVSRVMMSRARTSLVSLQKGDLKTPSLRPALIYDCL